MIYCHLQTLSGRVCPPPKPLSPETHLVDTHGIPALKKGQHLVRPVPDPLSPLIQNLYTLTTATHRNKLVYKDPSLARPPSPQSKTAQLDAAHNTIDMKARHVQTQ
jgi:hypothetical protein